MLITRFLHDDGIGEIEDYMPVGMEPNTSPDQLIRRVRVVRGKVSFQLQCSPAFDYARVATPRFIWASTAPASTVPSMSLGLASSVPLRRTAAGVTSEFTLGEGEPT